MRFFIVAIITLCLHSLASLGAVPVREYFFEDFETNSSAWNVRRITKPYSLLMVENIGESDGNTQPAFEGQRAGRFELRPGDYVKENDGFRTELKEKFYPDTRDVVRYSFATFIPTDYPNVDFDCMHVQWHNSATPSQPVGRQPTLAHRYKDGNLIVHVKSLAPRESFATPELYQSALAKADSADEWGELVAKVPMAKGRWHRFDYLVDWSPNQEGRVVAFMNGRKIVDYRGPVGFSDETLTNYFKLGMYCQKNLDRTYVVYHDRYERERVVKAKLRDAGTIERLFDGFAASAGLR